MAPTDSIRSITAWISASVAVGFITIIIWRFLSYAWEEYVTGGDFAALGSGARRGSDADAASAAERLLNRQA